MLTELRIENILLMEKIDISFDNGFSVITGQTGAGKSILIDSLNIILGDRAGSSILRDKEKNGTISERDKRKEGKKGSKSRKHLNPKDL